MNAPMPIPLDAPPGDLVPATRFETVQQAQQYLRAQGVAYVLAQFVDIHGVAKAKSVPVSHLDTVLASAPVPTWPRLWPWAPMPWPLARAC